MRFDSWQFFQWRFVSRDEERMRKTKELLSGLGNQEGDFRKMLKSKNKGKRKK